MAYLLMTIVAGFGSYYSFGWQGCLAVVIYGFIAHYTGFRMGFGSGIDHCSRVVALAAQKATLPSLMDSYKAWAEEQKKNEEK